MLYCKRCGVQNYGDVSQCTICGTDITQPQPAGTASAGSPPAQEQMYGTPSQPPQIGAH